MKLEWHRAQLAISFSSAKEIHYSELSNFHDNRANCVMIYVSQIKCNISLWNNAASLLGKYRPSSFIITAANCLPSPCSCQIQYFRENQCQLLWFCKTAALKMSSICKYVDIIIRWSSDKMCWDTIRSLFSNRFPPKTTAPVSGLKLTRLWKCKRCIQGDCLAPLLFSLAQPLVFSPERVNWLTELHLQTLPNSCGEQKSTLFLAEETLDGIAQHREQEEAPGRVILVVTCWAIA